MHPKGTCSAALHGAHIVPLNIRIFPKGYSVPPGTGHFWPQSQKCPKGSLETKVSRLPCALCLIRICDLVPHVRRGRFLSQRIKGLSPAAAPLPLMLCHGRSVCVYRKGGQSRPPLRMCLWSAYNNGTLYIESFRRGFLRKFFISFLQLDQAGFAHLLQAHEARFCDCLSWPSQVMR